MRFGVKDAPITVRRQLQILKQEENETLEEFSQRVHFLVMNGYPGALESTIEQIAVEHFLKGCIDPRAASVAMDKNPTHIHNAVKYTKDAINNRKVLYGKSTTTSAIRKVSFNDDSLSDEEAQQEYKVRKTRLVTAATEKEPPFSYKFEKECRQKFEDFETMLKLLVNRTISLSIVSKSSNFCRHSFPNLLEIGGSFSVAAVANLVFLTLYSC